jgi:elongation factor P
MVRIRMARALSGHRAQSQTFRMRFLPALAVRSAIGYRRASFWGARLRGGALRTLFPPRKKAQSPMKISGVDIRPGNILEYEGGIWKVAKIQHTQPGKGGAYMQVEMKNLQDGRKTNVRFRSADTIERVRLDTKEFQFLYAEGDDLVFMDNDTYEQITLPGDLLGDARPFLQDGMQVNLELWDEKPISVELPSQVEAMIVEADAVVKGQTASSSYKPAILDNGVRIMVPPHIGSGTRIIVDVYEQAYVGKAN